LYCKDKDILLAASALGFKAHEVKDEYILETSDGFWFTGSKNGVKLIDNGGSFTVTSYRQKKIYNVDDPCQAVLLAYNLASDNMRKIKGSILDRISYLLRTYNPTTSCLRWMSTTHNLQANSLTTYTFCKISPLIVAIYEEISNHFPKLRKINEKCQDFIHGIHRIEELRELTNSIKRLVSKDTQVLHARLLHDAFKNTLGREIWTLLASSYHSITRYKPDSVVVEEADPAALIIGAEAAWASNAGLRTLDIPILELLGSIAIPFNYYTREEQGNILRICSGSRCPYPYLILNKNTQQRVFESYTEGKGSILYLVNEKPVAALIGLNDQIMAIDISNVVDSSSALMKAATAEEKPLTINEIANGLLS